MSDATRSWQITRLTDAPPLPQVAWSLTIADVAQSMQNPEEYCELVKQWARVTLQQMPSLLQETHHSLVPHSLKELHSLRFAWTSWIPSRPAKVRVSLQALDYSCCQS